MAYMRNVVKMMSKTVAVIGGGAAGLMACGTAAEKAEHVLLIEKNAVLGRKVRITGKGRCNITNTADIETILQNIPKNPKFLYSALYSFTNEDVISFFESLGVPTKAERGGRVFPVSDSAKDVAEALTRFALKSNVKRINDCARHLIIQDGVIQGVKGEKNSYAADAVIIATGGKSYPLTGSSGDGYRLAAEAGHTVVSAKPSLIPLITEEKWVSEVMGLSLKNVELSVYNQKNKCIFSDFGEMLFTHFGISGPIVLSASAHMRQMEKESYTVKLDLKPALTLEQLSKRIQRDFEKNINKHFLNALDDLLPKALVPVIIRLSGIEPHKEVNQITREERAALSGLLKGLSLHIKGMRPIEEAIITSGGIKTSEINPSSMESKLVKGLFFAGEVIDVDAYTGGFNLQIAFSTGHLAGESV